MPEQTRIRPTDTNAAVARRNYVIFCAVATATMVGLVGGVIALFLQ
jgi:hypothetical protein